MDNATRKELLYKARAAGYPGSIIDVFAGYDQGKDVIAEFQQQQQMQQMQQQQMPAQQSMQMQAPQMPAIPSSPTPAPNFTPPQPPAPIGIQSQQTQMGIVSNQSGPNQGRAIFATGGFKYEEGGPIEDAKNFSKDPKLYIKAKAMGHNSIEEYKTSNWGYGKNHPNYVPPDYQNRVRINDLRTINATSGNPINPNVDLKSGSYHTGVIGEIARAAKAYNLDPQELMAIGLQESNLGKTDPNYGHTLNYVDPQNRGSAYDMAFAKTEKNKVADQAGYANDEFRKIQAYNGLGTVYPWTELDYHGFPMKSIYGVPLTNSGIDLASNPLYGKRIVDLRDNVLKNPKNAEYNQFLEKYNRDLANEEAVSKRQVGAYKAFNTIDEKYGKQYRDMLQKSYADSLDKSSTETEYIYPEDGPGWPVASLKNLRQKNMLDNFNKGIGYKSIPFKKGGPICYTCIGRKRRV